MKRGTGRTGVGGAGSVTKWCYLLTSRVLSCVRKKGCLLVRCGSRQDDERRLSRARAIRAAITVLSIPLFILVHRVAWTYRHQGSENEVIGANTPTTTTTTTTSIRVATDLEQRKAHTLRFTTKETAFSTQKNRTITTKVLTITTEPLCGQGNWFTPQEGSEVLKNVEILKFKDSLTKSVSTKWNPKRNVLQCEIAVMQTDHPTLPLTPKIY